MHPFELAVLLHTKFVTIHPFVDGNGRVARALLNYIIKKSMTLIRFLKAVAAKIQYPLQGHDGAGEKWSIFNGNLLIFSSSRASVNKIRASSRILFYDY